MRSSVLIKTLGVPALLGVIVILMYIFAGQFIYQKVMAVRDQQTLAKKEEQDLRLKVATLNDTQNTVSSFTEDVVIALPQSNPTLIAFSQIRKIAADNQISLSNVNVGAEVADAGVSKVIMSFDADGSITGVMSFLKALENIAPLNKLDKVKISSSAASARASVSVGFFWAPLPKQITTVTEGVSTLTPDEEAVLKSLAGLTKPEFTENVESIPSTGNRADPFTLQ